MVDSEPLAIAVATEWENQKEEIDRSTMHLVSNSYFLLYCNYIRRNWTIKLIIYFLLRLVYVTPQSIIQID